MSDVKSILNENEELKNLLADTNESLQGYEKDYDELCAELDQLKAENEALKLGLQAMDKENEEAEEDEEAEDEYTEEEEENEGEAKEEEIAQEPKESAEESQAKILAKALRELGVVQPVVTKPQAQQMSSEEVLAKFASITDATERGEFYAKHRNQIFN